MDILYITGNDLRQNGSANMSHNSFVQGFLANGCNVEIIMANKVGNKDNLIPVFKEVNYHIYNSETWFDSIKRRIKKFLDYKYIPNDNYSKESNQTVPYVQEKNVRLSIKLINRGKKIYYSIFKPDSVYPSERTWLNNASHFKCKKEYDIIISNSSPASSHRLATELLRSKNIKGKRWIQIWEDPWFHDLYGGHSEDERLEEHNLLREAWEIYYVSPLTLHYQKKYFPDCAKKMKFIPLPFLDFSQDEERFDGDISFGYFGDYYSQTRNLVPFYQALCSCKVKGNIYGNSNIILQSTETINVSKRVTLDILERVQNETSVLVHLCNLKGGQIPGKIYHYSATKKPILFILDGTEEEQTIIYHYFSKFNRYYFCKNTKKDIVESINKIESEIKNFKGFVVQEFHPQNIAAELITKD